MPIDSETQALIDSMAWEEEDYYLNQYTCQMNDNTNDDEIEFDDNSEEEITLTASDNTTQNIK